MRRGFKQLRKDRKDEDEAEALLKATQINLEETHARSAAIELQVCGRFDEYMRTWDEPWAATLHDGQNMADVAEQRHKDPKFDKKLQRTFGTWHNRQGGWRRESAGNTGLKKGMTNKPSHSCLVFKP